MTKVQINGKEYNLAYNIQGACLYERTTGRNPLNIAEEFQGSLENLLRLGYCMVISCNNEQTTPDIDEVMRTITADELGKFLTATRNEMNAYFQPLPGDASPVHDASSSGEVEDNNPNL